MDQRSEIAGRWQAALKHEGYAHGAGPIDVDRLRRLPRAWKRILRALPRSVRRNPRRSVLEVGTGGGKQLVPLALHGWHAVGIDVSEEVLARARDFASGVQRAAGQELDVRFEAADLFEYRTPETFDLVFHVGVIEHFLDEESRLEFLGRMFALARPGGTVVSVVPSGVHPIRARMKQDKLGGYDIPEIDYGPELMRKEFEACGGTGIRILPHNLMGYVAIDDAVGPGQAVKRLLFYALQLVPTWVWPSGFAYRHAYSLIGIARRP